MYVFFFSIVLVRGLVSTGIGAGIQFIERGMGRESEEDSFVARVGI